MTALTTCALTQCVRHAVVYILWYTVVTVDEQPSAPAVVKLALVSYSYVANPVVRGCMYVLYVQYSTITTRPHF